ncbi:MAG: hypothetical protein WAL49_21015 [Pseudolabrys sp.]
MRTLSQKAANWIENFCVYPSGFDKGQHVRLTAEQKEILRKLFDIDESPAEITAPLSRYLALLVVAGPRPLADCMTGINLDADIFTTWAATGPALKSVLKCDGGQIVCQELQTRFPSVAA